MILYQMMMAIITILAWLLLLALYVYEFRDRLIYDKYHINGHIYMTYMYNRTFKKITKLINLYDEKGRDCILPEGEIIVWKTCRVDNIWVYVKICVPKQAKRVTVVDYDKKYISRIEYGLVETIFDREGNKYDEATAIFFPSFRYRVNEIARPDKYDENINRQQSYGLNVHKYKDQCDQWFGFT